MSTVPDMDDTLRRALADASRNYQPGASPIDLFMKRYQRRRAFRTAVAFVAVALVLIGVAVVFRTAGDRIRPIRPSPTPSMFPSGPLLPTNHRTLAYVQTVAARSAWAFTQDSRLWRTTDGGATWRQAVVNLTWAPGFSVTGAVFPDANHAFVHSSAGDYWFITSDGGRTWRFITLPRYQGPKPTDTYLFGDSTSSWFQVLSDSTILWTVEFGYGTNWVCPNSAPRECDGKHPHPNKTVDRIFSLKNGSSSWSELTPAPFAGPMHFIDGNHAWGLTDEPYSQDQSSNGRVFWRTADAGRTWKASTIPAGLTLHAMPIFPTAQDGFALAAKPLAGSKLDPSLSYVLATRDGGATWSIVSVLSSSDGRGGVPGDGSLSAPDSDHLFVAIDNLVQASSDGGKTFEAIPLARREDGRGRVWATREISFPDATTGWALVTCANRNARFSNIPPSCGTYIYATQDGGINWVAVKAPA